MSWFWPSETLWPQAVRLITIISHLSRGASFSALIEIEVVVLHPMGIIH